MVWFDLVMALIIGFGLAGGPVTGVFGFLVGGPVSTWATTKTGNFNIAAIGSLDADLSFGGCGWII